MALLCLSPTFVFSLIAFLFSDALRSAIISQGCLPFLVEIALVPNEDVRIWAVWTLASLAETDACRVALAVPEVLSTLYKLSQEDDARIKSYVSAALANLAKKGTLFSLRLC